MAGDSADLNIAGITDAVEVGRGGFGVVYRGRQESFGRTVAIKVLNVSDLDEDSIRRFDRELQAVGMLSGHPAIVSVHAHGTTSSGDPYLLMEYCERGSYGDRLRRTGAMSWDEATQVVIAIAGALESAHRSGILHRDVKPDNILSDTYGTPKLTDFGIARVSTHASTTRTGVLTGSPAHVSPELVAGEQASASSDVYSLASSLHAMIAGRAPFQRDGDTTILPLLHRILNEEPPDLRPMGVPDPIWRVISQAMGKDPATRIDSAMQFGTALREARESLGLDPGDMRVTGDEPPARRPQLDAESTIVGSGPDTVTPVPDRGGNNPSAPPLPVGLTPPIPAGAPAFAAAGPPIPPGPATPPAAASTPPGNSNRTKLIVAGAVAVAVLVIGAVIALGGDGNGDGEANPTTSLPVAQTSTTASAPTSTTPPSTTSGSVPPSTTSSDNSLPAAVNAAAILFPIAELPGYTVADPALVEIQPDLGFCGQTLNPAGLENFQSAVYQSSSTGYAVVSLVAVFNTEQAASVYLRAIKATVNCSDWVDEDGLVNTVSLVDLFTTAQESDGYTQLIFTNDGTLEGDLSYLRQGRVIAGIVNVGLGPNDKDFSNVLTDRQSELLVSAVT